MLTHRRKSIVSISASIFAIIALTLGIAITGSPSQTYANDAETTSRLEPIDPQEWKNQYDMTWEDWRDIPGTTWNDPTVKPSDEGLRIALVAVDFPDQPFVITQPKGSDLFGNPQIDPIERDEVPEFYKNFYLNPNELNMGRTIHEYWMEQSQGAYGVDEIDTYGPYEMDRNLFEYGLNEWGQEGACPEGFECDGRLDGDVVDKWVEDIGDACVGGPGENCGYDVILRVYAGYDETSIWQEFGPMMFAEKEDVPDEWGPPADIKGDLPNWAPTRYVEWTSWRAAAQQWGLSSIRQAESSGTITHEMAHFFFSIGDNNNNPFSNTMNPPQPFHRVGAAPWDMMDRGSFNGPGGHHMRWVVPANMGGWSPAGLLLRNKRHMEIVDEENILEINTADLASSGTIVDRVIARAHNPGDNGTSGIWVNLSDGDLSPECDINTDPMCDGGGWANYTLEVVDRIGFDSFTPDSGVIIAKNKWGGRRNGENSDCGYNCFNWIIDANPEDIELVDYYKPTVPGEWAEGGEPVMATIADHRQLNDAAFHAGLNSGSEYEWVDEANNLHFYVIDRHEDDEVLSYDLAVRAIDNEDPHTRGVTAEDTAIEFIPSEESAVCQFPITNSGTAAEVSDDLHESEVGDKVTSDVYRVSVESGDESWSAEIQNALLSLENGESTEFAVHAFPGENAADEVEISLTVTSESDSSVSETVICTVATAEDTDTDADVSDVDADGSDVDADGSDVDADGSDADADGSDTDADASDVDADGSGSDTDADASDVDADGSGSDADADGSGDGGSKDADGKDPGDDLPETGADSTVLGIFSVLFVLLAATGAFVVKRSRAKE